MSKSIRPLSWGFLTAFAAGCTTTDLPEGARPTKPATVTITYNGAPVEGATITFVDQAAEPISSYGRTDAQGLAQMKTSYAEGAVVGTHKVLVTKIETTGGGPQVDQDSPDYVSPETLNLPPPVTKHHVPQKYGSPLTTDLVAEVKGSGTNEFKFDLTD